MSLKLGFFLTFVVLFTNFTSTAHRWGILDLKDHTVTEQRITLDDGGHLRILSLDLDLKEIKRKNIKSRLIRHIIAHKDSFQLRPCAKRNQNFHKSFRWLQLYQGSNAIKHYFYVQYIPKPGSVALQSFGANQRGFERMNNQTLLNYIFNTFWNEDDSYFHRIRLQGCDKMNFHFTCMRAEAKDKIHSMREDLKFYFQTKDISPIHLINCLVNGVFKLRVEDARMGGYVLAFNDIELGFTLYTRHQAAEISSERSSDYQSSMDEGEPLLIDTQPSNTSLSPKDVVETPVILPPRTFVKFGKKPGECLLL